MSGGFGPDHLPYGVVAGSAGERHAAARLGDEALLLEGLPQHGSVFTAASLDGLLAAGPELWAAVREELQDSLDRLDRLPLAEVTPVLPFTVADYVDFYASEHHATNVGRIFRPDGAPLTPNWKHLPIGYHGRAGTVVVSGTPVRRPCGQSRNTDGTVGFGPSRRLDTEAEVGVVVGGSSPLGTPVPLGAFRQHAFGVTLLNDWSARDIQAWESVPLGPFLGKSFATSVSAWVTPLAALEAAWTAPPARDVPLLAYLEDGGRRDGLDVALEVRLNDSVLARPPMSAMYWTPAQMLAHLTVNGASTRPGDLYASGTVSGPEPDQRGCLLELTWSGRDPVRLDDGSTRAFLEDGDEVVITATAPATSGGRLTLGEVRGRIEPAVIPPM